MAKKESCSICCCENPALGLGLLRIGVVLMFLVPGVMKLMDPTMIQGMVQTKVGIPGTAGLIAAWFVIIVEVGGGIAVALGNKVPKPVYKLSLLGFAVITVIATATIHWGETMPMLSHLLMLCSVACLFFTRPSCPMGICGEKK